MRAGPEKSHPALCSKDDMTKYLLTELGRAGSENIWLSGLWRNDPAAFGRYAMTASQIFSLQAFPISQ